jgi:exodeoxyribonuclease VII large subunit
MDAGTLTVGQLATGIDAALSSWFAGELWVQGEIDSLRRSNNGHVYFQLLERGDEHSRAVASINVALLDSARRYVNSQLKAAGGVRMTDGMQVRIRGRVEYYPPQGRVQLRMSGIDPSFTLALLLTERDRVLSLLAADGQVDRNRSVPLAPVPLRIGLATSDGSAAMADFVDELRASGFSWHVATVHVPVQGRAADRLVARAIELLGAAEVDAIALIRGGGSRLDLSTFDSELIGRAIARSSVPVFTGIGHEIDLSVADVVAHTSTKTPTACAAALVERVRTGHERAEGTWSSIRELAPKLTRERDLALRTTAARVARLTEAGFQLASHRVDSAWDRAVDQSERRLADAAEATDRVAEQLARRPRHVLDRAEHSVALAAALVQGVDPARLMERGWSITRTATGSVVRTTSDVSPGDLLQTVLARGTVESEVTTTTPAGESQLAREDRDAHDS